MPTINKLRQRHKIKCGNQIKFRKEPKVVCGTNYKSNLGITETIAFNTNT